MTTLVHHESDVAIEADQVSKLAERARELLTELSSITEELEGHRIMSPIQGHKAWRANRRRGLGFIKLAVVELARQAGVTLPKSKWYSTVNLPEDPIFGEDDEDDNMQWRS